MINLEDFDYDTLKEDLIFYYYIQLFYDYIYNDFFIPHLFESYIRLDRNNKTMINTSNNIFLLYKKAN